MSADDYVELTDLTVSYPDRTASGGGLLAIDRLKLVAQKGALFSVVGPNGCGKTTLLLCIAGVLKPTSGSVRINGLAPEQTTCGYVFQNYRESLYPWLTVLDNIAMPLWLDGSSRLRARRAATELIDALGLDLPVGRFPYTLSGGQQQLTALLRAVIHKPAVILLDEPLASLDAGSRSEIRCAMQRILQATSATTFLVTHDLDEAVIMADTVLALTPRPARVADLFHIPIPRPRICLHDSELAVFRERLDRAMNGSHNP